MMGVCLCVGGCQYPKTLKVSPFNSYLRLSNILDATHPTKKKKKIFSFEFYQCFKGPHWLEVKQSLRVNVSQSLCYTSLLLKCLLSEILILYSSNWTFQARASCVSRKRNMCIFEKEHEKIVISALRNRYFLLIF